MYSIQVEGKDLARGPKTGVVLLDSTTCATEPCSTRVPGLSVRCLSGMAKQVPLLCNPKRFRGLGFRGLGFRV